MTLLTKRKIDVYVFIYIRTCVYLQSELIWEKKETKHRTPTFYKKFAHQYQKSEIVETIFDLYMKN